MVISQTESSYILSDLYMLNLILRSLLLRYRCSNRFLSRLCLTNTSRLRCRGVRRGGAEALKGLAPVNECSHPQKKGKSSARQAAGVTGPWLVCSFLKIRQPSTNCDVFIPPAVCATLSLYSPRGGLAEWLWVGHRHTQPRQLKGSGSFQNIPMPNIS